MSAFLFQLDSYQVLNCGFYSYSFLFQLKITFKDNFSNSNN
jgi:hypothetical protein